MLNDESDPDRIYMMNRMGHALRMRRALVLLLLLSGCTTFRPPNVYRVRFETSQGDFVVEVHRDWAPLGADRFYDLATHGVFDGQRFFRVRAGVFVQFGIAGDPRVAQAWRNRTIADDPPRHANERGTIAYAFTTANTRATQVFINLADNRQFDGQGF